MSLQSKQVTGDFDEILAARNRRIMVLVTYSRTLYFNDKGQERGLVAEMARDFERYINQKYKTGPRPITIVLAPTTRDKLPLDVTSGFGDIAAASLTVTPFVVSGIPTAASDVEAQRSRLKTELSEFCPASPNGLVRNHIRCKDLL